MGLNFPSQYELLFDDKWDAAKDICLVQMLINDTKINLVERSANIPIASLHHARQGLNQKYDGIFSWDDVCARYANLKDRYRTFKALVEHPDVFWDELTNIVHANDDFWSNFCEVKCDYLHFLFENYNDVSNQNLLLHCPLIVCY